MGRFSRSLGRSPTLTGASLSPLQLEFVVQMTCQNCVDAVHKSLQGVAGKRQINSCRQSGRLWEGLASVLDQPYSHFTGAEIETRR